MEDVGPTVRLAFNAGQAAHAIAKGLGPDVRFAVANWNAGTLASGPSPEAKASSEGGGPVPDREAPTVRLAHAPGAQGDNALMPERGMVDGMRKPALLVSYYYLDAFQKNRHRYRFRDWVLDSGAFSAFNVGAKIDLGQYIEACRHLMATDPTLSEVFALDVIGDHDASIKNCEKMWEAGVPAIPCFHAGEPEGALLHIAKEYPKIALGGVALAKARKKDEWAAQCFARVWPKKVHGFGFGSEKSLMLLPWHSVDATNWEIGPCKFGAWRSFGGAHLSVRGSKQNLRGEVEWYLKLEERARVRWEKEMAMLESEGPTVRLAENGSRVDVKSEAMEVRKP